MHDPVHERVDRYTAELGARSEDRCHDLVALKMILHEARKRERDKCVNAEERRKLDIKWRFILGQVRQASRNVEDLSSLRADLAGKYPFQGLLTERYMQTVLERKQAIINTTNHSLGLSRRTSFSSSSTSLASSRSSSSSDLSLER
eukprot:TRINITY_DN2407_c8_g1_i1.p1 TRINITY_DN2407_c8_g1~~TRINITY_DN2407_c8_g1_i1.p1  ORF type:complete len:146 (+),score=16.36 TRINITY_DN2407_c8_g1_i1:79-516(+)